MAYSVKDYNPDDWKTVQATILLENFENNEKLGMTEVAYQRKYKNLYNNGYVSILPSLNTIVGDLEVAYQSAGVAVTSANEAKDKVNEVVTKVDKIAADVDKIMAFLEEKYNITFDEYYKKAL